MLASRAVKVALPILVLALVVPRLVDAADWEPPVAVSQGCCGAYFPHLLHDDAGTPHLWWVQADEGADARWRLRHAQALDGVFMPAQEIGGQLDARTIASAHAGDALHLVISAYRSAYGDGCEPGVTGGCSDIFFLESLDGGASWSDPQALPHPDDAVQRYEPTIVRDASGALVVVHDRDGTLHGYTRDPGGMWGAETMVNALHAGQQHSPQLTRTASGLHLLFRARPGPDPGDALMHTRLVDGAWIGPAPISPLLGGAQLSAVASDGAQRLQVAFQSSAAGEYSVYFAESLDDGATWSAPVQLSAPGYAARPAIARELGGDAVHVVWDRGATIAHAEAGDGGFTPELAISTGLEKSLEAHVSAGPQAVIAAWHGRATADGPYQIQVARRAATDPVPVDPTTGEGGTSDDATTDDTADTTAAGTVGAGTTGLSEETGDAPTGGAASTGAGLPDSTGAATSDVGETGGHDGADAGGCGCDATGGAPWWLALALVRRRRVTAPTSARA